MSTKVEAPKPPDISKTASDTLQAQVNLAPQQFAASALYDPQYAQLASNILRQTLLGTDNSPGLLDTYSQAAPQMQDIQSKLNQQQLQSNLGNLQNVLPGMVSSLQGANPQLQGLQSQMLQRAMSGAAPIGMVQGAQAGGAINPLAALGSWNDPRMVVNAMGVNGAGINYGLQAPPLVGQNNFNYSAISPVSVGAASTGFNVQNPGSVTTGNFNYSPLGISSIGAANTGFNAQSPMQAQAGGNQTLDQLNQTAQQQLALGGRLGQSEQDQIANTTLSYFNQMGRSADPIAAANLALNLDSAQQARLAQREQMAGSAAGLTQSQTAQQLQAQLANQQAGIATQGLGLQGGTINAQLQQEAALANQQAQLQNQGLGLQAATTGANLSQQAQLANQQAGLAAQGLGLQGGIANAGYAQQAALANQQAQLAQQGLGLQAATTGAGFTQGAQQANQAANLQLQGLGLGQATNQAQLIQQAGLANQQAGLQANLANQQAFLGQQGMNLGGAEQFAGLQNQINLANAGFGQQATLANQQAQQQNEILRQQQMQQAYQSLWGTTAPAINAALSSTLGPSAALGNAMTGAGQAAGFPTSSNNFNPFPMATDLYSQYYGATNAANAANANMSAGLIGGGLGALGSLGGGLFSGAGYAGGIGKLFSCWVARAVYGIDNPRWLLMREWMLTKAPDDLLELYQKIGPSLAERLPKLPRTSARLREHFDAILEREMIYAR